jgi:hypothetical protein
MQKVQKAVRWYEQEHWPYAADLKTVEEYANWLKMVLWKLFATLTFAYRVSDPQADKILAEFANRLERVLRCDVGFVCGSEKRLSGCGKPACGRHFHVLLTSVAPMHPALVKWLWQSMAGNRSDDAGALVEPYDPARGGAQYLLKFINKVDGDWSFRKLHLFHPEARSLQTMTKRLRRHLRRHKARQQKFSASPLPSGSLTEHMIAGKVMTTVEVIAANAKGWWGNK